MENGLAVTSRTTLQGDPFSNMQEGSATLGIDFIS